MYAIIETGGKQYRVQPGDTIAVERLMAEPGETLELDRVLLVGGDGAETRVGRPSLAGAVVRAEVLEHARDQKIIIFRFKSKVRYRRKTGHRQPLTRLRITDIVLDRQAERRAPAREPAPRAATSAAPPAAEPTEAEPIEAAAEAAPASAPAQPARRRLAPAGETEESTKE